VTPPALLAVAHGSPDPRALPVLRELADAVRARRREPRVELAFLGHDQPDVATAMRSLAAGGVDDVVVVPLLLAAAYHAKTDLPGLLTSARATHPRLRIVQADVLGPHSQLTALLRRRLREADVDESAHVVLGAVGSSDAEANAGVAAVAAGIGASVGFASCRPDIADVVAGLREGAAGERRVAIASYVLAPGTLPDRFASAGADVVTAPLGAEPEIVDVVLDRYDAVVTRAT
jgi:sirohydrochlorin ferrochelatase